MDKGWRPLPILLKIVFVVLIFRFSSGLFSLSQVYQQGSDFFGITLYGMYAVNAEFFLSVAFPVIILFGMYYRYPKIWIIAVIYFVIAISNALVNITKAEEILARMMEQLPEDIPYPAEVSPELFHRMLVNFVALTFVNSALFNLTMLIFVAVKRKYFTEYRTEPTREEKDLSS